MGPTRPCSPPATGRRGATGLESGPAQYTSADDAGGRAVRRSFDVSTAARGARPRVRRPRTPGMLPTERLDAMLVRVLDFSRADRAADATRKPLARFSVGGGELGATRTGSRAGPRAAGLRASSRSGGRSARSAGTCDTTATAAGRRGRRRAAEHPGSRGRFQAPDLRAQRRARGRLRLASASCDRHVEQPVRRRPSRRTSLCRRQLASARRHAAARPARSTCE